MSAFERGGKLYVAADFDSHHIEGYARAALEAGHDGRFDVPLISEIRPRLWMGGCKSGVRLPDGFTFVMSLYPWEQYRLPADCTRTEAKLFDSAVIPDAAVLSALATQALNAWLSGGQVLIHCQAGLNRSGLITSLVLMGNGASAPEAIALLREKRHPVVLCNQHFERFLLELAPFASDS